MHFFLDDSFIEIPCNTVKPIVDALQVGVDTSPPDDEVYLDSTSSKEEKELEELNDTIGNVSTSKLLVSTHTASLDGSLPNCFAGFDRVEHNSFLNCFF